ncbi:MAG: hypothetical protein RSB76_01645 [Clostridia bacterium]
MVIKGINLRFDSNTRLWYVLFIAIALACSLITATLISLRHNTKQVKPMDIFQVDKYITEYEVNINSNKNSNRYNIKEWYLNENNIESFKFETQNNELNMSYTIANNELKITSKGQINEYYLSEYIVNKKNILSISTFFEIYKNIINKTSNVCYKTMSKEYEDKICYSIIFNLEEIKKNKTNDIVLEYNNILRDNIFISKLELIVNRDTNIPVEYIIYDENKNAYIDILYNFFVINAQFDKKVFAF